MSLSAQMNIANWLTIFRIVMVPVFIWLMYLDTFWSDVIATVLYTIAASTDYVDGYIARKYNLITDLGKILDPIADKVLVTATLVVFVELHRLEAVVVIILITRDLAINALRSFAASKGQVIAAGMGGKIKTAFQMVGVGCIIFKNPLFGLDVMLIGKVLVYLSVILSVQSAWVYYRNFIRSENA
ncbi:CDP-diacylglycerol--glycerol-3-phosphate 3-phosphatidyltransferase [Seleniivibrio sp.]|uniref:CDP-diacylglycerol--glycerol-3-phosphate 3-phosphatidyltransferase n=1 Tax=Seleniivibrio sp. TaxID=2898801 RepID=UPI0025ED775D|nr:CDP-diacylglycerol--glycerol-3-phosphate 3-phosphatidyltransferase [Seleniivibrio sp.]MCD8554199.1 CDP-diacylglycerol--glycerol-3-phosphate 3-phosphatidyltransferase [Seleniivibrio sp.]